MSTAPACRLATTEPKRAFCVAELRPGNLFRTLSDPTRILAPLASASADVSEKARTWCVVIQTQRPTDVVGQLIAVAKDEAIELVAPVNPFPKFMAVS